MSTRKKPSLDPLSDEACIEQRRQSANLEEAEVVWLEKADEFLGTYEVSSSQWDDAYRVEIRDLDNRLNSCSCNDFRMNRLGTCKHIERVFDVITYRKSTALKQTMKKALPREEIFIDATGEVPRIRRLLPGGTSPKIVSLLDDLFDEEGFALGSLSNTWAALQDVKKGLSPRLKPMLQLSENASYWLKRERFLTGQKNLRAEYRRELALGRMTDNPVLHRLYDYQKEGMAHLAFKGRALLADEMGLGKTVQAIAAAELLRHLGKVERVLVVCPASLKSEWEDQLAFFTGQEALPIFGSRADRLRAYRSNHPFCVCNYEQIRIDVDDINEILLPDLIILDEAQRIKNWPTLTAKTIKRLESPYAFVLTGTPMENRIEELYSLMEFVDPHLFGSLERFQREFMKPAGDNPLHLVPDDLPGLHRRIKNLMLRRRKSDVDDVLPERSDKTYFVSMLPEQETRYQDLSGQVARMLHITKRRRLSKDELEKLQRLLACMRMTCDTPFILDADCRECPKLQELENILDERLEDPDCKIIIFSEWVRMLQLVREVLADKEIGFTDHTGSVPQKKRREHLKEFKENPNCRVLLSSESGGLGLNLQVANVVINLDLPWNPAKLEQRIARAWRKHQKRRVHVLNLVTQNSIEEAMIGKLAYKTRLSESVLDGADLKNDLRGEASQNSFLDRVRELMGHRAEAPSVPQPPAGRKEKLLAQHAAHILGIEEVDEKGPALVVARPDQEFEEISESLGEDTVVITPEMHQMLLRMQKLGLLSLNPNLQPSYQDEAYTPFVESREVAPLPLRFQEAANQHWQAVQNELKAVKALLDLGLHSQAAPHVQVVLKTGKESLRILYTEDAGAELPKDLDPGHTKLAIQLENPVLDDIQATLKLCEQLEALFGKGEGNT